MNTKFLWLSIIGIVLSFVGGFLLANSLNMAEMNKRRGDNDRLKASASGSNPNNPDSTLSSDEIRAKIAEADQNPQNFEFQRSLGIALYRYGATNKDVNLLTKSARILERANELNKTDNDVATALGNAYFDIAFFKNDNAGFETARKMYNQVLERKPRDTDVRTDLGLSYFLTNPPDDAKATEHFKKSLSIDSKHERTLQFLIQSLVRQNKMADAEKYLDQLKSVNPKNETIAGLAEQVAKAKTELPQ